MRAPGGTSMLFMEKHSGFKMLNNILLLSKNHNPKFTASKHCNPQLTFRLCEDNLDGNSENRH